MNMFNIKKNPKIPSPSSYSGSFICHFTTISYFYLFVYVCKHKRPTKHFDNFSACLPAPKSNQSAANLLSVLQKRRSTSVTVFPWDWTVFVFVCYVQSGCLLTVKLHRPPPTYLPATTYVGVLHHFTCRHSRSNHACVQRWLNSHLCLA